MDELISKIIQLETHCMVNLKDLFFCKISTFNKIESEASGFVFLQTSVMPGFIEELGSLSCFCIQSGASSQARQSLEHFTLFLHST